MRQIALAATLLAPLLVSPATAQTPARPDVCRGVVHAGAKYTVCTIDLRRYDVKLFLKAPDGDVYGSFARLAQHQRGLVFALNAGMYHDDRSPVGLYVENGQELKAGNT